MQLKPTFTSTINICTYQKQLFRTNEECTKCINPVQYPSQKVKNGFRTVKWPSVQDPAKNPKLFFVPLDGSIVRLCFGKNKLTRP